tara:strand:+ start:110 stop:607 length:498 start_codon:yes stop_codon:yes gene_type:complete
MKMLKLFFIVVLSLSSSFAFAEKGDVLQLNADISHEYFVDHDDVGDGIYISVMNKEGIIAFNSSSYGIDLTSSHEYQFGDDIFLIDRSLVRSLGVVNIDGVDLEYFVVLRARARSNEVAPVGTKFFMTPKMKRAFMKQEVRTNLERDGLSAITIETVAQLDESLE